jgi:hypothetical protein
MKKFRYEFLTISKNWRSDDKNVYSYEFINIGFTNVLINGASLIVPNLLIPATFSNIRYAENIGDNEKSETQYNIIFTNEADPTNAVIIIMKVLVP